MQSAQATTALGDQILEDAGLYEFVMQLLAQRGITDKADAEAFLYQRQELLSDPLKVPAYADAVARIMAASTSGEKVAIFGDFDADGLTATAILLQTLHDFAIDATYYIPDRHDDGHGFSTDIIADMAGRGVSLIITVDNGIGATAEVEFARTRGVDTIVTDHHKAGETLPAAVAIIHDNLLSGAGVAFNLARAMYQHKLLPTPGYLWALAAIGTISDRVPLVGENRIIVSKGLRLLAETDHEGLKALRGYVLGQRWSSNLSSAIITENDVGMVIGPLLNAPGRLGRAEPSLRLLSLSDDQNLARLLLEVLVDANKKRQNLTRKAYGTAEKQVAPPADPPPSEAAAEKPAPPPNTPPSESAAKNLPPLLVFELDQDYFGVLGLIATQLTKKFARPALGLVRTDGKLKGSIRSDIAGIHVHDTLQRCGDLLEKFGGHKNAGGFTIAEADLPKVLETLTADFAAGQAAAAPVKEAPTALSLPLEQLTNNHWQVMNLLRPFGQGNPEPVFSARGVIVRDAAPFGKLSNHVRGQFADSNDKLHPFVGFNIAADDVPLNAPADVQYQLKFNAFGGTLKQEIHLVSIAPAAAR